LEKRKNSKSKNRKDKKEKWINLINRGKKTNQTDKRIVDLRKQTAPDETDT